MRNPLFNLQQNRDADLKALEPQQEQYAGENNPYRGIEQHGVESPDKPKTTPGYGDTIAVEYEPEQPEPEPVPVYVVNRNARERRDWSVQNWPVDYQDPQPVQVAGLDERRISLVLRNKGPNPVYINKTPEGANVAFGWELKIDTERAVDAQTPVYANVDLGASTQAAVVQTLSVYAETLPNV